ncbi:MAG TPA: FkbM family methyltransferase [Steroidobacteraceae bacterium]|nr:FkbM family methyltransferase [Steroidobacteraceae bacterium]
MNPLQMLLGIIRHPLNRGRPLSALARFARWQIGSRLLGGPVAVPFAGNTRLLVARGMTGATGNIYCGLHEFEDMAFVLHALRGDDLFVDVGANIGSYTVLAAGAVGCRCVSIEPVPVTYRRLQDNLALNSVLDRVDARNLAVGSCAGTVRFTADLDTVNHALAAGEAADSQITVPVDTLDAVMAGRLPAVIKIDVEGFETAVIEGASATLGSPSLRAVLLELNGSGDRYGYSDFSIHERMRSLGFAAMHYDPSHRRLSEIGNPASAGNTLYVRNAPDLQLRLTQAPRFPVLDTSI